MSFCVNINSNEFKTLLKDTGLDSFSLELKVKSWQISNGIDAFPTAKEVLSNSSQSGIGYNLKATSLIMNNLDKVNNWFKQMKNTDAERAKKYKEFGIKKSDGTKITEQDIEQNPTFYQNNTNQTTEEFVASEKTIRDLAARMSDRIGIPVRFESDRTKKYKGKLENGTAVVNLAYATLDTPIHEILGHPIIRALKSGGYTTEQVPNGKWEIFENGNTIDSSNLFNTKEEALRYIKSKTSQLYNNLLKELEYGRGKEVLDRIKRDYVYKQSNIESGNWELGMYRIQTSPTGYKYYDTYKEAQDGIKKDSPKYTLEEQQEEAVVELLGLMAAEKLDNVKDGKLISLLKRLLKEMKQFIRSLINQKEVEIDKLPDNMTLGDIADLLAYSNSKLILPGNEVVYTTPDNQQFKTYAEASNHISQLAKNIEDVDLSDISLERKLSQEDLRKIEELESQKKEKEDYFGSKKYQQDKELELSKLNKKLEELENKKVEFYSQEPFLDLEDKEKYGFQDFDYIRVESTYGRGNKYHKDILGENYEGYYIHGYNTSTGKPKKKILPITKEQAIGIWEKDEYSKYEVGDRQEIYRIEGSIKSLQEDIKIKHEISSIGQEIRNIKSGQNTIQNFIDRNKEYEQSKEIIEEWKKVNNIQYNPEEIYSRGQEFSSVVGAYSNFDVDLMMQNLLSHIEDNEKAGGQFAISAYTKPVDKQIGHLEGGGGKIKFKLYPQSNDILWAANTDVYSGSVWDASEKVNKDKKSELLGVSYTKYPSLRNVNTVQPNLASIVDDLAHHHNELGITLTGNNFRLEYDEDIPYTTKKIIDGINKILDQKYGKLVKPEIKQKEFGTKYIAKEESAYGDFKTTYFDTEKEALDYKKSMEQYDDVAVKISKQTGIQPTQTKESLKESIESVKDKLEIVKDAQSKYERDLKNYNLTKQGILPEFWNIYSDFNGILDNKISIFTHKGQAAIWQNKEYDEKLKPFIKEESQNQHGVKFWILKDSFTKEALESFKEPKKPKEKEYTEQALVNTKIGALKEVAKKYPRSLIRSEVKPIGGNNAGFEGDELPFQKIPSPNKVNYSFKASDVIVNNIDKIKSWEKQIKDPNILYKKIQELGASKQTMELLQSSEGNTVEESYHLHILINHRIFISFNNLF